MSANSSHRTVTARTPAPTRNAGSWSSNDYSPMPGSSTPAVTPSVTTHPDDGRAGSSISVPYSSRVRRQTAAAQQPARRGHHSGETVTVKVTMPAVPPHAAPPTTVNVPAYLRGIQPVQDPKAAARSLATGGPVVLQIGTLPPAPANPSRCRKLPRMPGRE